MGRLHPNRQFLDIPLANGYAAHNVPSHTRKSSAAVNPIPPLHLTSREEVIRTQLQKERKHTQEHAVIVSQRIPGLKTSAAFFASLRTNLRLNASPPPSPISTPPSMRSSSTSLPPPSPLSTAVDSPMEPAEGAAAAASEDPMAGVPELKSYVTTEDNEKVAAMQLVADSIAQMRQTANNALIFNPVVMPVIVAIMAAATAYLWQRDHDVAILLTTCAGIMMISFALCRFITNPYITAAETIGWDWLGEAEVIVTKFGDEVIGTVIIDWVSGESRSKRKKAWRGEIKGWSVRLRYRGKGVGTALLEDVVKQAKTKGAETIEFADDHANSKRVLPSFFNSTFEKHERQSRELLQDLLETSPAKGRRKKG